MSKIICDVCGTKYPDSADRCPICGCVPAVEEKNDPRAMQYEDEQPVAAPGRVRGGRFSASNVRKRNQSANELEYEAYPEPPRRKEREEEDEEVYEAVDPQKRTNLILNILLVIVILALLAVSAYIFTEYFMPNIMDTETVPPAEETVMTEEPTDAPTEAPTEEPTIPCTDLVLEETLVELNGEGQMRLLNVTVTPMDTTDMLTYTSSDESVVTVNEEGRMTAVSEGIATITVSCGNVQVECDVVCVFNGETEPDEGDNTGSTEATEPAEPTEPLKDVTLKLNYEDLTFKAPNLGAKLKVTGLSADEVEWISDDPDIATVEDGQVISVGSGSTYIRVRYGEQEVSCLIRCLF